MIEIGTDFSGVGAFEQALIRMGINHKTVFACDQDKYARQTYELNFGIPDYFPKDVYNRTIPEEPLDIYVTTPPCQSFSLSGKREGENDKRGVLFYNSHEFIQKNKPRYFIFENVKGLLSDDDGKTIQKWIDYLGGKSVNGNPVIFPHEESVSYHIYYQVLNAKNYGVPQNRERIFIIGIRDDIDNNFTFPKPFHLEKRLKDVLEPEVDEKYFLSEKMIEGLIVEKGKKFINQNTQASQVFTENGTAPNICAGTHGYANGYVETENALSHFLDPEGIGKSIRCSTGVSVTKKHSYDVVDIGTWRTHEDGRGFRGTEDNMCPTIPARAREDGSGQPVIKITTNTKKGYEKAEEEEDSINFSVPNSKTRRGRVGKKVSQTLYTQCNQGIYTQQRIRRLTPLECFRLMDFNFGIEGIKDFVWDVSDSQAYKQAGNSIVVNMFVEILKKLNL